MTSKIKQKRKIDRKRLAIRTIEETIAKAIELIILGMAIGLSMKYFTLVIAGVAGGTILAKTAKLTILEGGVI